MDVAIWGSLSAGSLTWFVYLLNSIRKHKKKVKKIEETEIFTPSKLLKRLQDERYLSKWVADPDFPNEFKKLCCIEGNIHCDDPVRSYLNPNLKAVYLVRFTDELYSNDIFSNLPAQLEDKDNIFSAPLYFSLVDPTDKQSCLVRRSFQVKCGDDILEKIAEKTTKLDLSIFEQILVFLAMAVETLIHYVSNETATFRGFRVGITEKEIGIKVGGVLTTCGEVVYDRLQNSLKIDHPLYFFSSKARLLEKLQRPLSWKYFGLFFATLACVGSGIMLTRALKEPYQRLREYLGYRKTDPLKGIHTMNVDDFKCKKCRDAPRNVFLKPCLHFVLCKECAHLPDTKICPQCFERIDRTIDLYDANYNPHA